MKTIEITQELKRALSTESAFYEEETVAYIEGLEFALKVADLEAYNEWLVYKQAEYDKMKLAEEETYLRHKKEVAEWRKANPEKAKKLDEMGLTSGAYEAMFKSCASLESVPEI